MRFFKVSLKDFLILLIFSAPIGTSFYIINNKKIDYIASISRGFSVSENYCDNVNYIKLPILKDVEVNAKSNSVNYYDNDLISRDSYFSSYTLISARNDIEKYEVIFNGSPGDEEKALEEAQKIFEKISILEGISFERYYKNVKLNCGSGKFLAFKFVPLDKNNIRFLSKKHYKKIQLWAALITPFVILYSLLISIRYLNVQRNCKNKKNDNEF
jgi:hypothetical protein